jgi:hypothetical protein
MLTVIAVVAFVLGSLVAWFRWANRDVAHIEQIIAVWGMPTVDAIDAYRREYGRVPKDLEEAHIASPFTPYGYLTYEVYGTFGGDYDLYVYLGARNGYLRWDDLSRCWVNQRSPYELRWTEAHARALVQAVRPAYVGSDADGALPKAIPIGPEGGSGGFDVDGPSETRHRGR